jgi:N-acetylglucosaminyl-diphospho-decaprenol L-rhamnosyltransferase
LHRPDTLAVVVVTHQSAAHIPTLVDTLLCQVREDDEIVIVDNASSDQTPAIARSLHERVRVVETGSNIGFAGGCQVGVAATTAPLLLFLNPDAKPHQGCLTRLRQAGSLHPDWAAWQAAVLLEDGRINSSGGVVHYLGIGWAGNCERPISMLPVEDQNIVFPSGAAMVVRREDWLALAGMSADYFMYGEDLDFGLRLWLTGRSAGLVVDARIAHGYEFDKGPYKWFWMERNRWRTVLSVYPIPLLILLAPALLAAELGLLVVAAQQGWLASKLRAQAAVIAGLPLTIARRQEVQRTRRIGVVEFTEHLTASLDSPYLTAAHNRLLEGAQAIYWKAVCRILALTEQRLPSQYRA